ncbi:HTH_48 domain-containing protein [Trichonephila clavipes]|nr:HTH_48 domain-containing protein [Trichonephila clavipes]
MLRSSALGDPTPFDPRTGGCGSLINRSGQLRVLRQKVNTCNLEKFLTGRGSVENDERAVDPRSAITEQNIAKVCGVILGGRTLCSCNGVELVNLDREAVRRILADGLHMSKICAMVVPKVLSDDQKQCRKDVCEHVRTYCKRAKFVGICFNTRDEISSFTYDPESKPQLMHWKSPGSPRPKKARMSKSKLKAMLIVFFGIDRIVMIEWVPNSQTVNQHYYIKKTSRNN